MMMDSAAGVIRACGQALSGAGRDELACPAGESADDGRDREHGQAGQEHPLARQQVRDAATEQQSAAGHHQVGGDDPLHVGAAQVQVAPDGGQGRVDDRDVEDDEDLRGQCQGQDDPRLARPVLGLRVVVGAGRVPVVGVAGRGGRCGGRGGVDCERFGGGLGVHGNSWGGLGEAQWWSHHRSGAGTYRRRNARGSRRSNGRGTEAAGCSSPVVSTGREDVKGSAEVELGEFGPRTDAHLGEHVAQVERDRAR